MLPRYAYRPGHNPHPTRDADGHSHGQSSPSPSHLTADRWLENTEYLWGIDLYNAGFFWEAHEAWEGLWRSAKHDPAQRQYLQGLIQCAAASLKAAMRDNDAALRLVTRALARLERVHADRGDVYMGLDLSRFGAELRRFAAAQPLEVARCPALRLVLPP